MPTGNSLAVFSYIGQDVRTVQIDGEPWFVAADVAAILKFRSAPDMTRGLDADLKGYAEVRTPGGMQTLTVISEPAVYQCIFQSRTPDAREFQRWVTRIVLPEVRQTGSFSAAPAARALPHDFASALRELLTEVERSAELTAELEIATPRAEAWDALASAEGDFSVGDAAKVLARDGIATGPQRLFGQLKDLKWIFRGGDGEWHAYAERVEKGYLAEKLSYRYHPGTGERIVNTPQVRVTAKGIERLRQRLHIGALAVVS